MLYFLIFWQFDMSSFTITFFLINHFIIKGVLKSWLYGWSNGDKGQETRDQLSCVMLRVMRGENSIYYRKNCVGPSMQLYSAVVKVRDSHADDQISSLACSVWCDATWGGASMPEGRGWSTPPELRFLVCEASGEDSLWWWRWQLVYLFSSWVVLISH